MRKLVAILVVFILCALGYLGYQKIFNKKYHVHADFAVMVNGNKIDFSDPKYMTSTDVCSLDYQTRHTHLHNENGSVLHIHKRGQTVGDFFNTVGFVLTDTSIQTDTGIFYENNDNGSWRFFVNGKEKLSIKNYIINDLDQILISYGDNSKQARLSEELANVGTEACIYSEKCPKPENVILPTEICGSSE